MTRGQTIGKLVGHLTAVVGALLVVWAVVRAVAWGNTPSFSVATVNFLITGMALEGIGKLLVWFAGGDGE